MLRRRTGMYARSWPYHVLQIAEGLALFDPVRNHPLAAKEKLVLQWG